MFRVKKYYVNKLAYKKYVSKEGYKNKAIPVNNIASSLLALKVLPNTRRIINMIRRQRILVNFRPVTSMYRVQKYDILNLRVRRILFHPKLSRFQKRRKKKNQNMHPNNFLFNLRMRMFICYQRHYLIKDHNFMLFNYYYVNNLYI